MNTKRIITNAMINLCGKHSLNHITIDMIIAEAEVSRSTFYRHFRDKYDLVIWYYTNFLNNLDNIYDVEFYLPNLIKSLTFLADNKVYFKRVLKSKEEGALEDFITRHSKEFYMQIYTKCLGQQTITAQDEAHIQMIAAGSAKYVCSWILRGCDHAPQDIACWISEMVPPKIRKLIK